jgi:hypothetical protein
MWINKLRSNYENKKSHVKVCMKNVNNNKFTLAVSSVLGIVLILGLTVMLFSIVYFSILSVPYSPPTPAADIYYSYEGTNIIVTHYGGTSLDLRTKIQMHIGDNPPIIAEVRDYLSAEAMDDDRWGFGEQFIYNASVDISNTSVEVVVIDIHTDSVVSVGKN